MANSIIKRHTESVTHNTIGSILSTFIIRGVPTLISWLAAHVASLKGLALHWIILLFVAVFALATFGINQVRQFFSRPPKAEDLETSERTTSEIQVEESCPDGSLHRLAVMQAENIHSSVRTLDCTLLYKDLDGAAPSVNFNFHLFNSSVYSLQIDQEIGGWVNFAGRRLGGHLRRTDTPRPLGSEQSGYVVITQWLSKEDVELIGSSNQQCAFSFEDVKIWVKGDERFEEERKIIRQKLEIKCKIERVGQGVVDDDPRTVASERDALKAQLAKQNEVDLDWLGYIAKDQALTIHRFARITKLQFGKHELFRSDPYLEFVFTWDNRSVYDLGLGPDLGGAISFNKRELSGSRSWIERPLLRHGNIGSFTIRQALTQEDVVHILNGSPAVSFDFSRLQVQVVGNGDFKESVVPQFINTHQLSQTNEGLIRKYPKLEINLKDAIYSFVIDSRPLHADVAPTIVTLILWIANQRNSIVQVESIKLRLSVKDKQLVAYAEPGKDIHLGRDISLNGTEVGLGPAFDNLNAEIPLKLAERIRKDGALQFKFPEVQFLQVADDQLNGTPFALTLTASDGEQHHHNGIIKGTAEQRLASMRR